MHRMFLIMVVLNKSARYISARIDFTCSINSSSLKKLITAGINHIINE